MKRLIIAGLILATAACASAPQQQPAGQLQLAPAQTLRIDVKNDAAIEATVYMLDRGQRVRLGNVAAQRTARFSTRNFGESASFYITTAWGQSGTTNEVGAITAGDRLLVTIDSNLAMPTAVR